MTFQNKRNLWYVSGNKSTGNIFAHPTTEIGEPHTILTPEIASLTDSDVDGARRWIVVADDGEQAIEKLTIYLLKEVLAAEETAQSERGRNMTTIKLKRSEIEEQIKMGNNCNGSRVLAVAPDGSAHRIHWMETNRQWDPWPTDWLIIGIPALYPDGESAESEMAEECLRDNLPSEDEPHDADYIMEKLYQADVSVVTYAHDHFPNYMQAAEENQIEFLADAFLVACNGDGTELGDLSPWGYEYDKLDQGPIDDRKPPAEFEWS